MSVKVMNLVFESGPTDMAERFVMLALADNADDSGFAFPGVPLIAVKTCQSERNVLRVLKSLEIAGWLGIKRRSIQTEREDGARQRKGNAYQLNMAKLRATSHDTTSRDTVSPQPKSKTANKDTYKTSSDTVSCIEENATSGDKRVGLQVTNETTSSDNDVSLYRRTIIEPSEEPTTPPTPPAGGSIKSAFVSKDPSAQLTTLLSLLTPDARRNLTAAEPAESPEVQTAGDPIVLARCFLDELHDEFARVFGADHAIAKNRPGWEDSLSAWQRCFDHVRVAEVEVAEGDESSYVVVLETPRPRDLSDGLTKYKAKVTAAMNKTFGREVQLVPRMEAA